MPTTQTFTCSTGAVLRYSAFGAGTAVLCLHGAYSTHEEIAGVVEPLFGSVDGYRRLFPDLPGMGDTPPHDTSRSANDVVDRLDELISSEVGSEPLLLIGHSFGAHLARGIAARRADQVAGLALICPVVAPNTAEAHAVVRVADEPSKLLDPDHLDDYFGYFVVHTAETATRFNDAVAPSLNRFDPLAVESMMSESTLRPDPDHVPFSRPTLVLTGRHDSLVGYRDQLELISMYPDSTHVVLAEAGHALPHEHPTLTHQLLRDWLDRTITAPFGLYPSASL